MNVHEFAQYLEAVADRIRSEAEAGLHDVETDVAGWFHRTGVSTPDPANHGDDGERLHSDPISTPDPTQPDPTKAA